MIVISTSTVKFPLTPTVFPDGTSQVWKLPREVFQSSHIDIVWNFEDEREILDLLSLRKLLPNPAYTFNLHIPYLPYGRQDKEVSNSSTFNLRVFADLINSLSCYKVTTIDAHNPVETRVLIRNFQNIEPAEFYKDAVNASKPEYIVYPDAGARLRYGKSFSDFSVITCDKVRDQLTGNITGHKVSDDTWAPHYKASRFLIVDDLCDGGATFISVAKLLRDIFPAAKIDLCVTHGIFSRGRQHLYNNGISNIFTTNSLTKNEDGYEV